MKIKEIRQLTGLNQAEFSKKYKIPLQTLRQWEQGVSTCKEYVADLLEYKVRDDIKKIKESDSNHNAYKEAMFFLKDEEEDKNMLLQGFYVLNKGDEKLIVIDFGTNSGSLLEEVDASKIKSEFLKNSPGGGCAVVDGEFLRSCMYGETYGRFFKRTEEAVKVQCGISLEELKAKYEITAYLKSSYNKFKYHLLIRDIGFNDINVVLSSEAEKYREDIEKVLAAQKWSCRVIINAAPDEELYEKAQENNGQVHVNDIKMEDINTIYYEINIKK